jgi:hypothetical protein
MLEAYSGSNFPLTFLARRFVRRAFFCPIKNFGNIQQIRYDTCSNRPWLKMGRQVYLQNASKPLEANAKESEANH